MTIPDYQTLMLPTLTAFKIERTLKEAVEIISKELGLTEEEKQTFLPSGGQSIIYNRVGWAKFYLKNAGLLDSKKRGLTFVTEEGNRVLSQNPSKIDNKFLRKFSSFENFLNKNLKHQKPQTKDTTAQTVDFEYTAATPDEIIYNAYTEINEQLKVELLEKLKKTGMATLFRTLNLS